MVNQKLKFVIVVLQTFRRSFQNQVMKLKSSLFSTFLTPIFFITIMSYSSAQKIESDVCQVRKNNYASITQDEFKLKVDRTKLILTEVKYQCVYSAMYTSKGMFDRFRKWDQAIKPNRKSKTVFLWRNVKLFPNDTTTFNVATYGIENEKMIFASVMVFDQQYNDLLTEDSDYKSKLINYFSDRIKDNDPNKKEFYKVYWKTIDPEWWSILQRNDAYAIEEKRCPKIFKNDYKNIILDSITSVVDGKTIYLNEVKYECTFTSFYIKKGMYDRFGKWDQEIFPEGDRHPILLWKNVSLFSDDSKPFYVAAYGDENMSTIYSSVLVSDNQNNDMLSKESKYNAKLIDYFAEMIRSNDIKKQEFYDVYWKMVRQKK